MDRMHLAAAAAIAALLVPAGAFAQASSATADKNVSSKPATSKNVGTVDDADRKFMEKAALGGMAEVQMAQLARDRGMSDEVKTFASRMVTDHGKANEELKSLASSKGVTLPTEVDKGHKSKMEKLGKLQGPDFDRAFMKDMVKDHKKVVDEFRKEGKKAKDGDVQKWAQNTLPTLEEHLAMAEKTKDVVQGTKRTGDRETGSKK